jgi:hypothetical protein
LVQQVWLKTSMSTSWEYDPDTNFTSLSLGHHGKNTHTGYSSNWEQHTLGFQRVTLQNTNMWRLFDIYSLNNPHLSTAMKLLFIPKRTSNQN